MNIYTVEYTYVWDFVKIKFKFLNHLIKVRVLSDSSNKVVVSLIIWMTVICGAICLICGARPTL